KKAVEKPPYSLAFSACFGLPHRFFQHLRNKPAFGLSLKRVCLRSDAAPFQGTAAVIFLFFRG
ncbi:MAG: hypothetical protein IKI69_05500, partial [Oscillospiraceae bacterium]|nr:hypothetical protein [Oscillospiraceae bacterium]